MIRALAIFAAVLATSASASNLRPREYYEAEFFDYIKEHKIDFEFNGAKFIERLQIFADNLDKIERHNKEGHSYTMGRNGFTHMTWEEFREHFNIGAMPVPVSSLRKGDGTFFKGVSTSPDVDHTALNHVTQVKDQGNCGSCWSFSTTGALEGAEAVHNGVVWNSGQTSTPADHSQWEGYSEQDLVSCDRVDSGCNGGWMTNAFSFIQRTGGICSEADYPYASGDSGAAGSCQSSCTNVAGVSVTGFTDVTPNSESDLLAAAEQQPVAIAVAVNSNFQLYTGGVFDGTCGQDLNHGVLLTGYGTDGSDYWIVKNSWGSGWGESGYIRVARANNLCHIQDAPSFPNV